MLIGLLGNLGSFKTTYATYLARLARLKGIPVYSNYKIDWKGCYQLDFAELMRFNFHGGLIILDEVYTVAESRISSSKLNRFFSYFIFQSRKLGVDVVWTAQLDSSVDKRLYMLTPMKFGCYGEFDGFCEFECLYDGLVSNFAMDKNYFERFVFPYFNTYQTVEPVGMQELLVEMYKFDYVKMNQIINDYIAQICSLYSIPDDVYKYEIEDIMAEMGLAVSLASAVTSRIKRLRNNRVVRFSK